MANDAWDISVESILGPSTEILEEETDADQVRYAAGVLAALFLPSGLVIGLPALGFHPMVAAGMGLVTLGQITHACARQRVQRKQRELVLAIRRDCRRGAAGQDRDDLARRVATVRRYFQLYRFVETIYLPGGSFVAAIVVVMDGLFLWHQTMEAVFTVTVAWAVLGWVINQFAVHRLANALESFRPPV